MTGQPQLRMLPEDVNLARQLHPDRAPRDNITAAWKNLADVCD